jgi:predicted alpha/beta-hydrolase family hydrolase
VSGLLQVPVGARICFVLAHGAGAGMSHPFMAGVADGLAERGIATMRYQFPCMEQGSKRPDAPKLAQGTVRAAVSQASHLVPKLALVAVGKSFGGRIFASPSGFTVALRPRASLSRVSPSFGGAALG